MPENFPKWMRDINLQIQKVLQTLKRIYTKKTACKPIIVKLLKTKDNEKILKMAK